MAETSTRRSGVLADWNDARGFGFIEPTGGGARVFVHVSAFGSKSPRPADGDVVAYELGPGPDGRPRAARAQLEPRSAESDARAASGSRAAPGGARMPSPLPPRRGRPALLPFLPVLAFAVFLVLAVTAWGASVWFASIYIGMSAITFGIYAWDKQAAIDGAWRTRESTLQAAALLCGWPGAVVAQQLLRHKSRKVSFQLVFWSVVLVNVAAFVVVVWRPVLVAQLSTLLQ